VRVALCQIDATVGDLDGNAARIADFAARALAERAQVAVFPELALCGYPPGDLLVRPSFVQANERALAGLARRVPPQLDVLVGCITPNEAAATRGGRAVHNAVALLQRGTARIVATKTLLPTYDVFDESRYFEPNAAPEHNLVTLHGRRVGVVVCEDGWNDALFFDQRNYAVDPVERVVQSKNSATTRSTRSSASCRRAPSS
jgi:NAD+ synthase (glutamine-hydrolysing)